VFECQPGDARRRRTRQGVVEHPDDVEVALAAYEAAMFPRSASAARDAHAMLNLCLGDRAPYGLVDFLSGAA
jgi:hypothetical protein